MKSKYFVASLLALSLGVASCGGDKTGENANNEGGGRSSETVAAKGDAAHGQQLYRQTCAPCHGAGGKGDGPAAATLNPKPADHTSKSVIGARTDEELANIIKMGGGIVGKPTMPPSPQFNEKDLADLVAHMRQISGTEHK
jgi:mono/diheme cytochrome c family protein